MDKKSINIIAENIILDINCGDSDAIEQAKEKLRKNNISQEILSTAKIYKKSIDTRHKNNIKFVYSVIFDAGKTDGDIDIEMKKDFADKSLKITECDDKLEITSKIRTRASRPVVIGFGPAGMFCALLLSMYGCKPVVFEMGGDMDGRIKTVDRLFKDGILDEKTNVCFGEGGAGTFSDGKLITRVGGRSKARSFVMQKFAEFGAPEDILYNAKPHVGTDKIREVTKNIRNEIIKNGGEIYFNAELTDIRQSSSSSSSTLGSVEIVINNSEKFTTEGLFLAIGHSAFKTYDMLLRRGFRLEPKPYSVGLRIEHTQEYVDSLVYGDFAGHKNLPPAEYALSHTEKNSRGVYTFCMCPGGAVVNSSTENGGIVTNGMSYSNRNMANANAAIAVSIYPEDFGNSIDGAFNFRRNIEEAAFKVLNSKFAAPIQTLGDFMNNSGTANGAMKSSVKPSYTGRVVEHDINKLLPGFVCGAIKEGITKFDKILRGYYIKDAILTAPETRTSSAVRITRNAERLTAINFDGVYPMGEGAGYAGGITSSAADGVSCAVAFLNLE